MEPFFVRAAGVAFRYCRYLVSEVDGLSKLAHSLTSKTLLTPTKKNKSSLLSEQCWLPLHITGLSQLVFLRLFIKFTSAEMQRNLPFNLLPYATKTILGFRAEVYIDQWFRYFEERPAIR